jgi:hypothetical protein
MLRTLPSQRGSTGEQRSAAAARCGAARRDGARPHADTIDGEAGFTARRIFDSVEKSNIQTIMPVLVV